MKKQGRDKIQVGDLKMIGWATETACTNNILNTMQQPLLNELYFNWSYPNQLHVQITSEIEYNVYFLSTYSWEIICNMYKNDRIHYSIMQLRCVKLNETM